MESAVLKMPFGPAAAGKTDKILSYIPVEFQIHIHIFEDQVIKVIDISFAICVTDVSAARLVAYDMLMKTFLFKKRVGPFNVHSP